MTRRAGTGTQDRDTGQGHRTGTRALFHFPCKDFPISLILISQSWVTCPPLEHVGKSHLEPHGLGWGGPEGGNHRGNGSWRPETTGVHDAVLKSVHSGLGATLSLHRLLSP